MFGGAGPMKFRNDVPEIFMYRVGGIFNGSANVIYETPQSALNAIKLYDNTTIDGCLIGATKALRPPPERPAPQQRGE